MRRVLTLRHVQSQVLAHAVVNEHRAASRRQLRELLFSGGRLEMRGMCRLFLLECAG